MPKKGTFGKSTGIYSIRRRQRVVSLHVNPPQNVERGSNNGQIWSENETAVHVLIEANHGSLCDTSEIVEEQVGSVVLNSDSSNEEGNDCHEE